MAKWVFLFLIFSALVFVLRFGKSEERLTLLVLVFNFFGTAIAYWIGGGDWLQPKFGVFLIDLACLFFFVLIAFRSKRFWPLPVAAFQMVPVMTSFVTFMGIDLSSQGVGITQGAWGYAQLLILIVASIRGRNLGKRPDET
ncbi:hypothetical protein [Parasphingorhabdus halotolerans]|uniref:Uncharacterized protein n=1 Tax=Parasphingorhabdus halotolerans TaxID=2725558 RepID=A0A6H2DIR7_9SPHN|nr:hypothetical protein [Parasphingorhabdus halotolerans]QJB68037.1 hypothetical protein HF685_00870 [Parasphingorhabdus halotolerans]